MDFLQLQCDPRTDLISLKKHLDQGFGEEKQSYCKSLSNKYDQVSRWIKQKASIENPEMIDKDEIGQTLVPEDIILKMKLADFLLARRLEMVIVCFTPSHVFWLVISPCLIFFDC